MPLTVGLSDYWTITRSNILCRDLYIFPMYNRTTWTIGLLLYLMFSINTVTHLLEYKRPCAVGLLDYWTIAPFNLLLIKIFSL